MENNDTNIVADSGTNADSTACKRSEVKKCASGTSLDFLTKIRNINKQGPHFLYERSDDPECDPNKKKRLIKKSGKYNVSRKTEYPIWEKYLRDLAITLVHSRYRWIILAASSSFIFSWLTFALIYMVISNANSDLDPNSPNPEPCLSGINSFAGYFMFSLETQATIGYGSRYINHYCPESVFVMCLQMILGCGICGFMVNIVYMKMIKPPKRNYKDLFSKKAVICRRDGDLCLIFRVKDEDNKHAISTAINAYLLRKDKKAEVPCLESIPLEPYGVLIWPLEIVHKITPSSPLWDVSSYDLIADKFELIVSLMGTSPTTGQCTKTRSSYLSSEILWGHNFKRCIKYNKQKNAYIVNQQTFNETQENTIHLCSAKRFFEVFECLTPSPTSSPFARLQFEINIVNNNRNCPVECESNTSARVNTHRHFYNATNMPCITYASKSESNLSELQSKYTNNRQREQIFHDHNLPAPYPHNAPKMLALDNSDSTSDANSNSDYELPINNEQETYLNYKNDLSDCIHSLDKITDANFNRHVSFLPDKYVDLHNTDYGSIEQEHNLKAGNFPIIPNIRYTKKYQPEIDLDTLLQSLEDYLEKNTTSNNAFGPRKF